MIARLVANYLLIKDNGHIVQKILTHEVVRMFKRCLVLGLTALCLGSMTAQADDLMQVYNQALHNDPTFKQAQSTWWSAKQDLPIAVSAYLPQIAVTDTLERQWNASNPNSVNNKWRSQNALTVTATQAIFDFSAWTNIAEQAASVKSATATYLASVQDLMQRTVQAYLNVLQAYDILRFTVAQKNSVKRQLVTAQQQFKVGLIAITGVYDAQSRYDQSVADEITNRNNLYDQLENLRAITGQHYTSLRGVIEQVPLIKPVPNNINVWVQTAESQNYTIKSDQYAAESAHENIKNQLSAALPSVDATASYGDTRNFDYSQSAAGQAKSAQSGAFGLSLSWDPFQGGATYFATKQARYDYLTAVGALEASHRSVVSQTRQAFLGILSGISRIRADKQSIISAQNELKATQAGYEVGTRTMVDVLNSLTQVYQAKSTYMQDQYAYINEIVSLKEQAGTLNTKDIEKINSWLNTTIKFSLPTHHYSDHGRKGLHPETAPALNHLNHNPHKYPHITRESRPPLHGKAPQSAAHAPAQHHAALTKKAPVASTVHHQAGYLVQLYAGRSKKDAQQFIARQPAHIQKLLSIVQHGQYYGVAYGAFPTHQAASKAAYQLPSNLRHHTWIYQSK